jgi:hypothetical protein
MKEYIVYYTLENAVKQERIIKDQEVKRNEIIQEILDKIMNQNAFMATSEQGDDWIDSSTVRYVRVV